MGRNPPAPLLIRDALRRLFRRAGSDACPRVTSVQTYFANINADINTEYCRVAVV